MDWSVLFNELLSGSPWAIIVVLGWWHFRRVNAYEASGKKKDGVIESQAKQIKTLNREYRETFFEMAQHVEAVMEKAHKETLGLQEQRVRETRDMQREFVTTMTQLGGTLRRIEVAVQSGGE